MIDHIFADFGLPGVPGASVMVIRDGQPVYSTGYGLANLEMGTPCAPETNFRLASVTKQFTAMSILMLHEAGKLSLDDRLPKFFPGFPNYGKDITVRMILTHTSGLLAYEDFVPDSATDQVKDHDVLKLLEKQNKTMFPPGSQFHYSNTGYAFLALIVEVVSGKTYAQFLRDSIFQPLNMTNSVAYEKGISTVPNRALGYTETKGANKLRREFLMTDQSSTSAVLGDGGIYSSTVDMFKWDQALYTEKLISKELLREAYTAHSNISDFKGSGYGYGWYIGNDHGVPCVWHYGSTCGFSTHIERFPEKKFSIIILTNRRNAPMKDLSRALIDACWT